MDEQDNSAHVETIDEHDDSDTGSLPGLQERISGHNDSWNEDEIDSNLDSIDSNWMTTTEETKPIVPTIRLRGGVIEDEIDDYYDNNNILVEMVEEEKPY